MPAVFIAILVVVIWAISGPIFGFSESWQLIINTGTTITTFIMVFIIQNSQNRDSRAMQTKLDDIIEALEETDETLVGLEAQPEKAIKARQKEIEAKVSR